jgi:hypothetical protein
VQKRPTWVVQANPGLGERRIDHYSLRAVLGRHGPAIGSSRFVPSNRVMARSCWIDGSGGSMDYMGRWSSRDVKNGDEMKVLPDMATSGEVRWGKTGVDGGQISRCMPSHAPQRHCFLLWIILDHHPQSFSSHQWPPQPHRNAANVDIFDSLARFGPRSAVLSRLIPAWLWGNFALKSQAALFLPQQAKMTPSRRRIKPSRQSFAD